MADDIKTNKAPNKKLIKKTKKSNIKVERTENQIKEKKQKKEKNTKEDSRPKKKVYHDYSLVFAILFLMVYGLIMIYSVSSYYADKNFHNAAYYVIRQFRFSLVGIVLMIVISYFPYKHYIKHPLFFYCGSVAILLFVLIIGRISKGSKRWLGLGSVSFQPSEFVKVAIIICMSYYLIRFSDDLHSNNKKVRNKKLIILFLLTIIPTILIAIENLSTAIIIFLIAFCMSFLGTSGRKWHIIGVASMFGLLVFAKKFIKVIYDWGFTNYRFKRLLVWVDPERYNRDGGYQVVQGLYSIGSGGLFGKGIGQGIQKMFVPESQNDMIFAIIVEEMGLFGALLILSMFAFIISRMLKIAFAVKDLAGMYIVIGIMIHLALQVILNIAVVTGVLPNTGVILPFISYGGSSIIALSIEMGIVFNVAKTIKMDY